LIRFFEEEKMRKVLIIGTVLASLALAVAGCSLAGGGVTITGTIDGSYFSIFGDVALTLTRGETSYVLPVTIVESSQGYQIGSFLLANLPAGEYTVEIAFDAGADSTAFPDGTTYSVNDGAFVPADSDVVSGDGPYTHTITIESLSLTSDATLHIYFGDVG
jgi:hypothetical protein